MAHTADDKKGNNMREEEEVYVSYAYYDPRSLI